MMKWIDKLTITWFYVSFVQHKTLPIDTECVCVRERKRETEKEENKPTWMNVKVSVCVWCECCCCNLVARASSRTKWRWWNERCRRNTRKRRKKQSSTRPNKFVRKSVLFKLHRFPLHILFVSFHFVHAISIVKYIVLSKVNENKKLNQSCACICIGHHLLFSVSDCMQFIYGSLSAIETKQIVAVVIGHRIENIPNVTNFESIQMFNWKRKKVVI